MELDDTVCFSTQQKSSILTELARSDDICELKKGLFRFDAIEFHVKFTVRLLGLVNINSDRYSAGHQGRVCRAGSAGTEREIVDLHVRMVLLHTD